MDLKILVYQNGKAFLDNKPCFRATVIDVPLDMEYHTLVKAFKLVYGSNSCVSFNII